MNLEVKDLQKSYGKNKVLNHLSFSVGENEIVGLLGSNGNGKSTLIKCINDLLVRDGGEILVDGKPLTPASHHLISYLPEKTYLNPDWTAERVIRFFADFYPDFDASKARKMILEMELDPAREIKSMSKGMQEKLQLALVMSRRARLYILDEPLGGVDPAARDRILDTILTSFEEGSSMLISTHMISDIERILDRVLFLKDGRIVLDENAEELRERIGSSVDQAFRKEFSL